MTKFIGVFHSVFMKAHKTNSKVDEFVNYADIEDPRLEFLDDAVLDQPQPCEGRDAPG